MTVALTEVTREFAGRHVLGPVDLRLDAGVLAVIGGLNGAGKTTLLRIAAGLLPASTGHRMCAGRAVYLRPGGGARHPLTVAQVLAQTAALTGTAADVLTRVTAVAGVDELAERRVNELSAGQHARLTVALAAAASPRLACLDEPTAQLDPNGVEHVRAAVEVLRDAGTSVLLVSHSPQQFADLADALLRLDGGLLREVRC